MTELKNIFSTIETLQKEIDTLKKNARMSPTMLQVISFILIGNAALVSLGLILFATFSVWLVIDCILILTNFIIGVMLYSILRK